MPRNVEIKARVRDPARVLELALALGDGKCELMRQHDTFYQAVTGRLKLRRFADGAGELIAYRRPDRQGPKTSRYVICPVPDPDQLHATLAQALGVRGVVAKERTLIMCGRTRIHLDRVQDLGEFIELEVVLAAGESEKDGRQIAQELMARLAIAPTDLVTDAYIDQLNACRPASRCSEEATQDPLDSHPLHDD